MDEKSIKRLEAIAPRLHEFFELEDSEREWLFPMLSRNIQSTIELLELIEEEAQDYEELSYKMGMHFNTIKQKLLALKRGGFPLNTDGRKIFIETGRPRVLTRRTNEIDQIVSRLKEKGLV